MRTRGTARGPAKALRKTPPISVPFPRELKERAQRYAKEHNLQLAAAVRVLVTDHLDEIEDAALLSRAEEWQRAEAWATWEKTRSGDRPSVSRDEIVRAFAPARARRGSGSPAG